MTGSLKLTISKIKSRKAKQKWPVAAAIEKIRLASADCSEQLNQVRREPQMCEGERSSLEALEKAGSWSGFQSN